MSVPPDALELAAPPPALVPPARPSLFSRSFLLLVVGQLLQSLGYATLPIVPVYLTAIGATRTELGLMMAVGSIGGLLARPAIGTALDRFGRRPVLLLGTVLLALGTATIGLVDAVGAAMVLNRLVFGLGVGMLFTGYFAAASDIIPEARRTEGLAIFGIAGIVPLMINPVAQQFAQTVPTMRVFFAVTGGVILCSVLILLVFRDPPKQVGGPQSTGSEALRALVARPLWPVWLATVLFAGLIAAFFAFANVTATARNIANASWMWVAYAGVAVSLRLFAARLPDLVGPSRLMIPSLGFYAAALVVMGLADQTWHCLVAGVLAGIGHGYGFPVISGQVITRSAPHLRGRALSVFTGLWDVALLCFTPLYGLLADRTSDAVMFDTVAGVVALGLAAWFVLERRWAGTFR